MTQPEKKRRVLFLKKPVVLRGVTFEYRLVWNENTLEWNIYRNGADTGLARRKKQSAIDTAIFAIKSDERLSGVDVKVVSLKDRVLAVEWMSGES